MADRTPSGKVVDARAREIVMRRAAHQIGAMRSTTEKYEIDILEAQQNIERLREGIKETFERIDEKTKELEVMKKEINDG